LDRAVVEPQYPEEVTLLLTGFCFLCVNICIYQKLFLFTGIAGNKNSAEFRAPETPGQKILQNPGRRNCRDEKFRRIPDSGTAGTKNSAESRAPELPGRKNSAESRTPELPGQKIPQNPGLRNCRDEKFRRIPDVEVAGTKKMSKYTIV
jgi:hypothetical protein